MIGRVGTFGVPVSVGDGPVFPGREREGPISRAPEEYKRTVPLERDEILQKDRVGFSVEIFYVEDIGLKTERSWTINSY